jgi:hypothetical protein
LNRERSWSGLSLGGARFLRRERLRVLELRATMVVSGRLAS